MEIASNRASSSETGGHAKAQPSPEPLAEADALPQTEADASPQSSPDAESLNKIRDILFGQQVQTHDLRFERLEQRLREDYAHLRVDIIQRIEALESRLLNHLDSLTQRLKAEETARDREVAKLDQKFEQKLDETVRSLDSQAARLEETLTGANQDVQAEIKHQTLTLKDALEQQVQAMLTNLEEESQARQRSTRAERAKLSMLLGKLSQQLNDDDT